MKYKYNATSTTLNVDSPITLKWRGYPVPPAELNGQLLAFSETGAVFFSLAYMLVFVSSLHSVVEEKANRIRFGMQMMGVTDFVYWSSWFT